MDIPTTIAEVTRDWLAHVTDGAVAPGPDWTIEAVPGERGSTGDVAVVRDAGAVLGIVKLPAATAWERAWRELVIYRQLAPRIGIALPALLGAAHGDAGVALVLEYIDGASGAALPVSHYADQLAGALGVMHGQWWQCEDDAEGFLPRWGEGTRGDDAPYDRRVARFRRRIDGFCSLLATLGCERPALRARLEACVEHLADDMRQLAHLPITLVHGDVHAGNIRLNGQNEVVLLDWQSASRGPAQIDLARFVLESLPEIDAASVLDTWATAARAHGAPDDLAETTRARWPALVRTTVAGFVSGHGGMTPATCDDASQARIARAMAPGGLLDARCELG